MPLDGFHLELRPKTFEEVRGQDHTIKVLKEMLSREHKPHSYLLYGPTGCGKCLGKDTPVLMYDGSVKLVQDIKVKDKLMGDDSTPRNVLSLSSGKEELYEIVPVKGDSYIVNKSHILSLKWNASIGYRNLKKGSIVDISLRDYTSLAKWAKILLKGYRVGVEFPNKNVPLDPYIIGYWLGDGLISFDVLGVTLKLTINKFVKVLKQLNLKNNKHIPDIYKFNSRTKRLRLLAGLIDSDGHYRENCYYFSLKSKQLSDGILYLCRSLGFAAYSKLKSKTWDCVSKFNGKRYKGEGNYYCLTISGKGLEEIPVLLKRKQAHFRNQIKEATVTGITVKSLGVGKYFGFELDGNGRFLLGDFTVTHNTTLARLIAKELGCNDIEFYEMNTANTRGIDTVRDVIESSQFVPMLGKVKVFLFDECFPGNARIELSNGSKEKIGKIYSGFKKGKHFFVKSLNRNTNKIENKKVTKVFSKYYSGKLVKFYIQGGDEFTCTDYHKILTSNGYIEARKLNIGDKVLQYTKLDNFRLQAIKGMAIGDSGIQILKNSKTARLRFNHGISQQNYCEMKYDLLRDVTSTPPKVVKSGGYGDRICTFSTQADSLIYETLKGLLKTGKKVITREYLNGLDDISLAFWYMDDGSIGEFNCIQMHTEGFTEEENNTICEWLRSYLGLQGKSSWKRKISFYRKDRREDKEVRFDRNYSSDNPVRVQKVKKNGKDLYFICLNVLASELFLKKVSKYIYPFMGYKSKQQVNFKNPEPVYGYCEVEILKISEISHKWKDMVYDIEVEDNHNFLVGRRGTIVSNCHMITGQAAEALLKFLEDTPKYVYIILATTNPEKLIPTVKGRCEKFPIHSLKAEDMMNLILDVIEKKELKISDKIIERIHEIADGCPREALLLLEKVCNATEETDAIKTLDNYSNAEWIKVVCGFLLNRGKNWDYITQNLKDHDEEDVENIRRGVLGYMQRVLVGKSNEMDRMRASEVVEIFGHTFWEGGRPKLVQAFYKVFLKMTDLK